MEHLVTGANELISWVKLINLLRLQVSEILFPSLIIIFSSDDTTFIIYAKYVTNQSFLPNSRYREKSERRNNDFIVGLIAYLSQLFIGVILFIKTKTTEFLERNIAYLLRCINGIIGEKVEQGKRVNSIIIGMRKCQRDKYLQIYV